jgi:radical SAM superfamily enzyme YgiQ (UPF0313 family)
MKILLVWPEFDSFSFWNFEKVCRVAGVKYMTPPLGLLTVAALLPQQWEVKVVDENTTTLTEGHITWADVVFVGSKIVHRGRAQKVIRWAKSLGKTVIIGGPDPTISPQAYEGLGVDCLCSGEGEEIIPRLATDLEAGTLRSFYRCSEPPDLKRSPAPRFDLIDHRDYLYVGVQYSRGCPYHCEFCNVIDLFDHKYRTKSLEQILQEFQILFDLGYRGQLDFFDDNLVGQMKSVKPFLRGIAAWLKEHDYPFQLSTSVTLNIAKDEELLFLLREARFKFLLIGIETPDQEALRTAQKQQNTGFSIAEATDRIYRKAGATVHSGFLLGMDGEARDIGDQIIRCIDEACVPWVMAGIVYPLPGTQLSQRLQREGRLFAQAIEDMPPGARDQISAGIQFKPQRPVREVLGDLLRVMRHSFDPREYFSRCERVAVRLNTIPKLFYGREIFWRNLRTVFRLVKEAIRLQGMRGPFFRGLLTVLFRNPRGLEAYVTLSVLYLHFESMLSYCYGQLEGQLAQVEKLGEAEWLARNLPPKVATPTPASRKYLPAVRG